MTFRLGYWFIIKSQYNHWMDKLHFCRVILIWMLESLLIWWYNWLKIKLTMIWTLFHCPNDFWPLQTTGDHCCYHSTEYVHSEVYETSYGWYASICWYVEILWSGCMILALLSTSNLIQHLSIRQLINGLSMMFNSANEIYTFFHLISSIDFSLLFLCFGNIKIVLSHWYTCNGNNWKVFFLFFVFILLYGLKPK